MKYENNHKFSMLLLLAVLISGCQKDFIETNNESYIAPVEPENLIKLGKKLDNPYDISVMKEAFKNITEVSKTGKLSGYRSMKVITDQEGDTLEFVEIPEDVIRITHKYVRFKPRNQEEMDAITGDSTLVLFDHPLDYEIEQEGDYYHDPKVHDTLPTPQYATVKISQKLNDTIPFEILSELYLPEEDAILDPELLDDPDNDQVVTVEETTTSKSNPSTSKALDKQALKSFASKGKTKEKVLMMDALVAEAFRLTNNEVEEDKEDKMFQIGSGQTSRWFGRRKKWTPEGTIQTYDNRLGRKIALEGVKVKGWRWFTRRSAITNSSGYYRMGRVRKKYFKYRIVFERHHFKIKSVGTLAGDIIRWARGRGAAEISLGKHRRRRRVDRTLTSQNHRYLADIFRGAHYYYYKNISGLRRPPRNTRWSKPKMKIAASRTNSTSSHVHQRRWLPIIGSQIAIKEYGDRSDQVIGTTIHELAHASHWNMDRANYNRIVWKGYIDPTIAHGGDLNPDNKRARRLLETWATTVEIYLTRKLYRDNYLRTYRYTRNDLQQKFINRTENDNYYTTCGYDMIDNENQSITEGAGRPVDRVSGYTIRQLENALRGSDVWGEWKDRIKGLYNNPTENNLNELFNNWSDD